jgi:hypothetical protein
MVYKKLALLAVVALLGLASAVQAQARFSGFLATNGSSAVAPVRGLHGEPAHGPAFVGRPFFHRQFVPPFAGISAFYAYGPSYPTCWTWLPTHLGWRRAWVCNWPYGLGYDYY